MTKVNLLLPKQEQRALPWRAWLFCCHLRSSMCQEQPGFKLAASRLAPGGLGALQSMPPKQARCFVRAGGAMKGCKERRAIKGAKQRQESNLGSTRHHGCASEALLMSQACLSCKSFGRVTQRQEPSAGCLFKASQRARRSLRAQRKGAQLGAGQCPAQLGWARLSKHHQSSCTHTRSKRSAQKPHKATGRASQASAARELGWWSAAVQELPFQCGVMPRHSAMLQCTPL